MLSVLGDFSRYLGSMSEGFHAKISLFFSKELDERDFLFRIKASSNDNGLGGIAIK
jgi:hypothetical protein